MGGPKRFVRDSLSLRATHGRMSSSAQTLAVIPLRRRSNGRRSECRGNSRRGQWSQGATARRPIEAAKEEGEIGRGHGHGPDALDELSGIQLGSPSFRQTATASRSAGPTTTGHTAARRTRRPGFRGQRWLVFRRALVGGPISRAASRRLFQLFCRSMMVVRALSGPSAARVSGIPSPWMSSACNSLSGGRPADGSAGPVGRWMAGSSGLGSVMSNVKHDACRPALLQKLRAPTAIEGPACGARAPLSCSDSASSVPRGQAMHGEMRRHASCVQPKNAEDRRPLTAGSRSTGR